MTSESSVVLIPERRIPVPSSVSAQAQAFLAQAAMPAPAEYPKDVNDKEGWRAIVEAGDLGLRNLLESSGFDLSISDSVMGCAVEELDVGECTVYAVTPPGIQQDDHRLYLYIHGGGWQLFGGLLARALGADTALAVGATTWSVDYRMPPEHPFPTPLDDCVAAYKRALQEYAPEDIVVAGVSAGANLSAAMMIRLHDEGVPLPAAVVLDTPATDLTEAGDTWATNLGVDPTMTTAGPAMRLYAGGQDLRHPYLSPLFGALGPWYPPTVLLSGTRDVLLSDTVRFHRALLTAGATAELHIFEAQGHVGFLGQAPEDQERSGQARTWAEKHWPQLA